MALPDATTGTIVEPRALSMGEHGCQISDEVLSGDECGLMITALVQGLTHRGRAGTRHLMAQPAVATLAADRRLVAIAAAALGGDAVPFRATLFEKTGDANWLIAWHQDTALPLCQRFDAPGWGPWSEKFGVIYAHAPTWALSRIVALRVHLDESMSDNGPLRVVPGSHTAGVLTDEEVSQYASGHEQIECLVPRGGILAMRPMLIHASSKAQSKTPRRVLHIEYADSLELAPDIRLVIA